MKDDFRDSFTEFALDKRPSTPEVARVLREVRRQRGQKRPPYHLWALGVGGWLVAAVSLTMLAKQSHEPREDQTLIQSDPDRVEHPAPPRQAPEAPPPEAPAAPPPETPAERPPPASASPVSVLPPQRPVLAPLPPQPPPAPSASAAEPAVEPPGTAASSEATASASAPAPALAPRLPFEERLLLARGHYHRIEGILELLREVGTSTGTATKQQCVAGLYRKILDLRDASREQIARLDAAGRSGDTLAFDQGLERLVSLRRSADGEFQRVRVCFETQ